MKIQHYRSSFIIHLIDTQPERSSPVAAVLSSVGYTCFSFKTIQDLKKEVEVNAPHFVILNYADSANPILDTIHDLNSILPETQIFLLCERTDLDRPQIHQLIGDQVYDYFVMPLTNPVFLIRSVDRAAELNYQIYFNEQLKLRLSKLETESQEQFVEELEDQEPKHEASLKKASRPMDVDGQSQVLSETSDSLRTYLENLYRCKTNEECIELFSRTLNFVNGQAPVAYFQFLAGRRMLVGRLGLNVKPESMQNIGIDLNRSEKKIRTEELRRPEEIGLIREMAQSIFGASQYHVLVVDVFEDILGLVFIFLDPKLLDRDFMGVTYAALIQRLESLIMEKRLHSNRLLDQATEVLNQFTFKQKIEEEIARSRRTSYPASLVVLSLDHFEEMVEKLGQDDSKTLLRILAKIFKKHSRLNDILGRISVNEFGLLLPHTSKRGAIIKAERLRRIISSADFSKFISGLGQVTVSVAVSEYPTLCHDGDELIASARSVLDISRQEGSNQVGLARVSDGFVADFIARE